MSEAEASGAYIHTGNSDKVTIVSDGPRILHQGRYRLYEKLDGGLHLVYQRDDADEPTHMEIPGAMMRLAKMAGEGALSPADMIKEMMKLRSNGAP